MPLDYRLGVYLLALLIILNLLLTKEIAIKIGKNLLQWLFSLLVIFTSPKILLTFGIAWMITNGWSYIFVFLGVHFRNNWLLGIGSAYQTFLWIPITPEKIVTVAISIWLGKLFFPKDKKLQARLLKLNPKNIVKIK